MILTQMSRTEQDFKVLSDYLTEKSEILSIFCIKKIMSYNSSFFSPFLLVELSNVEVLFLLKDKTKI